MIRKFMPWTAVVLLAASAVACDKPGATEQQKEDQAREQAASATNRAAESAQNAQASADKDITEARIRFEKVREDYRHTRRNDLADLDKKIVDLGAQERVATGKTRADLDARLPSIRAQRDAFVRDMQALDTASAATWDAAKADLDREWESLKAAVDKAS